MKPEPPIPSSEFHFVNTLCVSIISSYPFLLQRDQKNLSIPSILGVFFKSNIKEMALSPTQKKPVVDGNFQPSCFKFTKNYWKPLKCLIVSFKDNIHFKSSHRQAALTLLPMPNSIIYNEEKSLWLTDITALESGFLGSGLALGLRKLLFKEDV